MKAQVVGVVDLRGVEVRGGHKEGGATVRVEVMRTVRVSSLHGCYPGELLRPWELCMIFS